MTLTRLAMAPFVTLGPPGTNRYLSLPRRAQRHSASAYGTAIRPVMPAATPARYRPAGGSVAAAASAGASGSPRCRGGTRYAIFRRDPRAQLLIDDPTGFRA